MAKVKTPPTELSTAPFSKDFLKDEVFAYPQFEELRQLVLRCINERSMAFIGGEAGAGKTTGVRACVSLLPTNRYQVVYVGQDQEGVNLSRRLSTVLGIPPQRSRAHTWLLISQYLCDNLAEQGKEIVLVIDEAHLLDKSTLEDIRLLTNADFDRTSPATVILIGQLSLRTRLKVTGFEALNQRLRFKYALEGLTEEETGGYIKHRLEVAELDPGLFSADAIKCIFLASQGIPREINNLCTTAIMKAQALNADEINAKLIRQVIDQNEVL